jgi:(p)ppGpp synthase/HD superfamily hydrolase
MSTTKATSTDQAAPFPSEWRTFGGEALLSMHGYPELLEKLEYLNAAQRAKVELAYRFATFAHDGQLRKSGEPYITHPVAVAAILAGLQPDVDTLLAGLLHDTVEDTNATLEDVEREFGGTDCRGRNQSQ